MIDLPDLDFGNDVSIDAMAKWRAAILALNGVKVGPGVRISSDGPADTLKLDLPIEKYVLLNGNTSPYAGQEVMPTSGGGWTALPGVSTIPTLYEYNALAGLNKLVVRATLEKGDEWRFHYITKGGSGPGCTVWTIAFFPTGCLGSPADGVVTLTGPVGGTTTIGADGWATFTFTTRPPNGSYTATCASTNYALFTRSLLITSASFTMYCGVGGGMPLTPDSDHVCCTYPNYPSCRDPIPKTLKLVTTVGDCDIVYDPVFGYWTGGIPVAALHCTYDSYGNCVSVDMSGTAYYTFVFFCDGIIGLSGGITMTWAKFPDDLHFPPVYCDRGKCVIADPTCGYVGSFGAFGTWLDPRVCMPRTFQFDSTIDYLGGTSGFDVIATCPNPFAGNATVSIPP